MLDIGWSEMLMVAVVAIIVIGPKDLPRAMRTVGQWVRKVRSTVREFQDSVDDMVRESELEELRNAAKTVTDYSPKNQIGKLVDPTGSDLEDKQEAATPRMIEDDPQAAAPTAAPAVPAGEPGDGGAGTADAGEPDPAPADGREARA